MTISQSNSSAAGKGSSRNSLVMRSVCPRSLAQCAISSGPSVRDANGSSRGDIWTLDFARGVYQNAISLDGGWRAWNEAGLPVEKG
jgi:hypothetical protein